MKTENKNMRITEPGGTTEGRGAKETKYKPIQPVALDTIPEDAIFIHSADVYELLNISNSTLRNLRVERAIPFCRLDGTFLYSKEEVMNYLASNYSRKI